MNTNFEEDPHHLLCWLVTAECLGGCMGGDAVISAAMTLQSSPVWHPTLSHPHSTMLWPQIIPPLFPPLLSRLWSSPPSLISGEALIEWKKRRNIYVYYDISLYKKKDFRGASLIVKCRDYALYDFFSEMECTGNVLILYIFNLRKSNWQIKDKFNLRSGHNDVALDQQRSNERSIRQLLSFHCLTCSCEFWKGVTDILLWMMITQL